MATLSDSLSPEVLQYLQGLRNTLPTQPGQTSGGNSTAQSVVDAASVPPSKFPDGPAADSASVFEDAGMIPAKSAASSAAVFENPHPDAPPVAADQQLVPLGERGLVAQTPEVLPAEGAGEAALWHGEHLPAPYTGGLPAEIPPAAAEGAAGLGAGALGLGSAGAVAEGLAAGQVAQDAVQPHALGSAAEQAGLPGVGKALNNTEDSVSDYIARLVGMHSDPNAPVTPPSGNQVDWTGSAGHEAPPAAAAPLASKDDAADDEVTTPAKAGSSGTRAPAAASSTPAPTNSDTPTVNPLLAKYLQDRQDMQDAQGKANTNRLIAGIANAGGMAAASTYGANKPIDQEAFKELEQNANAPVEALQAKQAAGMKAIQEQQEMVKAQSEQEANDPSSKTSQVARQFWQKVLPPSMTNSADYSKMSANDIKTYIQQPAEYQQKMDALKMQKQVLLSEKTRIEDEKDATAIANKMNFLTASSRSALGSAANAKTSVARLAQIASDPKATPQDMENVYADLNRVVSGSTTLSGTEHQAYNNLNTKLASLLSYWKSTPQAADIPEVKQHILQVAQGMDKISDNVIDHNTKMVQMGHQGWISRHPDQWQSMVSTVASTPDPTVAPAPGAGATPASATPASATPTAPASGANPNVQQNGYEYQWDSTKNKYVAVRKL